MACLAIWSAISVYFWAQKRMGKVGGGYCTRFEPLTKWLPQIVEEVVLGIKQYFTTVDLTPYQQLCQHFSEKTTRLPR